jgi:hypothetical protein
VIAFPAFSTAVIAVGGIFEKWCNDKLRKATRVAAAKGMATTFKWVARSALYMEWFILTSVARQHLELESVGWLFGSFS